MNCYRYDDYDETHWNMFDYVNDTSEEVGNFVPNTDLTYGDMKSIVLAEWTRTSGNKR